MMIGKRKHVRKFTFKQDCPRVYTPSICPWPVLRYRLVPLFSGELLSTLGISRNTFPQFILGPIVCNMVGGVALFIVVGVASFVPCDGLGLYEQVETVVVPRFFISSGSAVAVNSSVITWVSAIVGFIILGSLLYIAYASVADSAPPGGYGNYRYKRDAHPLGKLYSTL